MEDLILTQTGAEIQAILNKLQPMVDNNTMASLGFGYGTCTTAGGTAAKEASVSNYLLVPGAHVSILFTNAFTATSPTLNINSKGAKPIKLFGSAIAPGKVRANTVHRQFGVILCPDAWQEEEEVIMAADDNLIRKVNPHVGTTIQSDFYAGELAKARQNPDYRREVMTKLFNVFQSERTVSWLQPRDIRPLQIQGRIDEFKAAAGWIVFCGMDFSQGTDLHTISYLAINTSPEWEGPRFFADFDAWVETLSTPCC